METPQQALKNALIRMKFHTRAEDLTIYKTPGGWYHVTDSTFEMILNAPTARTLALCIDAYVDGYLQAIASHPQTQEIE
jgi:translation elongation factor EF-1alpha